MANSAYVRNPFDEPNHSLNGENSLEGFHNDIHNMCGSGAGGHLGHMGLNEFAAFDPIFFLHHT
jgi:tyrosinase